MDADFDFGPPPLTDDDVLRADALFAEEAYEPATEQWAKRQPVPELPPVPTLPPDMVSDVFRGWCTDVASRACIPLEMVAVPAMVSVGAIVGRAVGIRPERHDRWTAVPNLWGGCVAPPGWLKSHAVSEATKPIRRLATTARERFDKESSGVAEQRALLEAQIAKVQKDLAKDRSAATAAELVELRGELAKCVATERRYMTQDATTEKLGELLRDNPRGLLLARDELAGWLRAMERPGREGDREFYLEAWNGDGSYTVDRIGRGTIHIPALTLSVVGGIQPGKLREYVNEAQDGGNGADGLIQRVQLLVWPDRIGDWSSPGAPADQQPRERAYRVFEWLDALPDHLGQIGAQQEEHDAIPWLRFTPAAQEIWDAWRNALEHRLRAGALDAMPAYASHLSKYRSLMPSLALLFHLLEASQGAASGGVSEAATRVAADWCDYLDAHARKVYAAETSPGIEAAGALATRIEAGSVLDGVPLREIYRNGWSKLTTPEIVRAAAAVLAEVGWCRVEARETDGRPSEVIRLHPELRGAR